MLWGPAWTMFFDAQLVFNTAGSVLSCKIVICGFVFVGAQRRLGGLYMAPVQLNTLLGCTSICVFILCIVQVQRTIWQC